MWSSKGLSGCEVQQHFGNVIRFYSHSFSNWHSKVPQPSQIAFLSLTPGSVKFLDCVLASTVRAFLFRRHLLKRRQVSARSRLFFHQSTYSCSQLDHQVVFFLHLAYRRLAAKSFIRCKTGGKLAVKLYRLSMQVWQQFTPFGIVRLRFCCFGSVQRDFYSADIYEVGGCFCPGHTRHFAVASPQTILMFCALIITGGSSQESIWTQTHQAAGGKRDLCRTKRLKTSLSMSLMHTRVFMAFSKFIAFVVTLSCN